MQSIKRVFIFLLFIGLTACGDPVLDKIEAQIPITEQRVELLAKALSSGDVRNANLINQYADKIIELKPDLAPLAQEFKKDATAQGPMYLSLQERLLTVLNQPQMFVDNQERFDELVNIYQAADLNLYSDALSDPLNVLSDMSDGVLPRINSLSKEQSLAANGAEDFGTGSQLVGNPSYGQWQSNGSGMSFWAWYGMYSMMDNMFGGRRIYYDRWGRSRGYSYYNDYGRYRYTSPKQRTKQTNLDNRMKKSFASTGQKYTSPYSKNRTGSSGLSKQSKTAQVSSNKFRQTSSSKANSFAKKSKYSNNASLRNSRTTTSRSFRSGK